MVTGTSPQVYPLGDVVHEEDVQQKHAAGMDQKQRKQRYQALGSGSGSTRSCKQATKCSYENDEPQRHKCHREHVREQRSPGDEPPWERANLETSKGTAKHDRFLSGNLTQQLEHAYGIYDKHHNCNEGIFGHGSGCAGH